MYAARWGHVGVVQELLAAGAEKSLENVSGRTALMLASAYGNAAVMQELSPAGSDA